MRIFLLSAAVTVLAQLSYAQNMGLALEGDAWAGVKEYPVKGRALHINQKLVFGPFKTVDVDRSWTRGRTATSGITQGIPTSESYRKIITTDHISKKQTLYFTLGDSTNKQVSAYCVSRFNAKDFNIGNDPNSLFNILLDLFGNADVSSSLFYVILMDADGSQWELLLDNQASQQISKQYQGYLMKSKDEYYVIKPVSRVKTRKGKIGNMPFGSAGYEIQNKNGKPLAAVSVIDRGVVYLTELNDAERLLLATVCSAILLQEEI